MNQKTAFRGIVIGLVAIACSAIMVNAKEIATSASASPAINPQPAVSKPKVTFVELGSVNCVPCKAMKVVTDKLEKKYPKDLRIVFHDVWTEQGEKAAAPYNIRSIPTQVFLDQNGSEFFRHEGYYPQDEIEKLLKTKQVNQ